MTTEERKAYNKKYAAENKETLKKIRKKCDQVHKAERRLAIKGYRQSHKLELKDYEKNRNITKYGITRQDYNNLYEKQLGLCSLCHKPFGDSIPHIDHCHKTNKVRGLLHRSCNLLLGHAKDDPQTLQLGIEYLKGETILQ